MATDPVCGMEVEIDSARETYRYQGVTYYFCSPGCREAFEVSPRGMPRGEITQVSRKQRCAPVVNAEPVPNRSWDAIMVGASFGMELAAAIELAGAEKRYDLRSRFARVHLSTRAERAVYLVLVCDRTRAWSAEEIARLKDVEQAAVERALAGFASAGIVEIADGTPARHRWRAEMDYLFGEREGEAERVDPVCSMRVAADSAYFVKDYEGANVWFCSSLCRAAFVAFPSVFASRLRAARDNAEPGSRDEPLAPARGESGH